MALNHTFVSAKADGGDATLIRPSNWNEPHVIDTDGLIFPGIVNAGTGPGTNNLRARARKFAERVLMEITGQAEGGYALQAALWDTNVVYWTPTTATAGSWQGSTGGTTNGTYANIAPTWTNRQTAQKRSRYSNIATTANQVLGQRNTEALWALSTNSSCGGFFYMARGGFATWTSGGRFFAGLNSGTNTTTACPVIAANPSTVGHSAGFCIDDTDGGAITFLTRNGTTANKFATTMTAANNSNFDFIIYAPTSQTTSVHYLIIDNVNNTTNAATITNTLPAGNTGMMANFSASNAALTAVNSIQVEVNKIYIESVF